MRHKGQVTVFVIIGLVIVIIVGIILYAKSRITDLPDKNLDTQITELKKSINTYVTDCMTLVTAEAIKKAGEQGGDLYDVPLDCDPNMPRSCPLYLRQDGAYGENGNNYLEFTDPADATHKHYFVSYGIKRYVQWSGTERLSSYDWNDGAYPDPAFTFNPPSNKPYFGQNTLRYICDYHGPNGPKSGKLAQSCGQYSYDYFAPHFPPLKNLSVQEQLATYIAAKVATCVDMKSYVRKGYAFTVGAPNVGVILSDSAVTVLLDYPLNISGAKHINQKSMNFITTVNSPIKKMFEYAYGIIQKDISNLRFDMSETGGNTLQGYATKEFTDNHWVFKRFTETNVPCTLTPSMKGYGGIAYDQTTYILPPAYDCSKDDIIRITDPGGFMLQFAVQNRRPVLDKIVAPDFFDNAEGKVKATAIDPDDQEVFFLFDGWGFASDPAGFGSFAYDASCDPDGTGMFPTTYLFTPHSRHDDLWFGTGDGAKTNPTGKEYQQEISHPFADVDINKGAGDEKLTVTVTDDDPASKDTQEVPIDCCDGFNSVVVSGCYS